MGRARWRLGLLALTMTVAAHPDAPYAVGSQTFFLHDTSRPFDAVAGIDVGIRTLITEVWYPVAHAAVTADARRATYGDYVFGDFDVHRTMMTATTFFHLTPDTVRPGVTEADIEDAIAELFRRERGSYVDAPMAQAARPFPVVLMSHGDAGSRYNMESACEALAAHGYVVVAPEHTGNSPFAQVGRDPLLQRADLPYRHRQHAALMARLTDAHGVYGDPERHGQSYSPLQGDSDPVAALRQLDAALVERVNDLRAALAWIDARNRTGAWQGRLDAAAVGVMGRSFGAATVLAALGLEARFGAGFAVVAPAWSDPRPGLPQEVLIDDRESVLLRRDGAFPLLELSRPTLLLSAAEDALIIGLAAARARAGGSPLPTRANPHPALYAAFRASRQPAVWGLLADADHGLAATSGPSWWPDLKPDRLPRTFDPAASYQLVPPATAQAMQQQLAIDFFDRFLRHDPEAAGRLADNRWAGHGLELETVNLQ